MLVEANFPQRLGGTQPLPGFDDLSWVATSWTLRGCASAPALGGCLGHPPPGAQPFAEHYSQFDSTIRPIGLTRAVVRSAFLIVIIEIAKLTAFRIVADQCATWALCGSCRRPLGRAARVGRDRRRVCARPRRAGESARAKRFVRCMDHSWSRNGQWPLRSRLRSVGSALRTWLARRHHRHYADRWIREHRGLAFVHSHGARSQLAWCVLHLGWTAYSDWAAVESAVAEGVNADFLILARTFPDQEPRTGLDECQRHGLSHRTKADEADRICCVHHRAAPLLSARTML